MQLKEFDILLDVKKHKKIDYIEVVQGDYETNILNIQLCNDLDEFNLEGLIVEIAFAKSDGTTVVQDADNGVIVAGNKIICTLSTNTIAAEGRVKAEVRVFEGTRLLTSSRFELFVRKSIVNDETIESTNEFPLLQRLTDDVQGVIATEATRVTAEGERVDAENNRVQAEQDRATAFEGYEDRVSTVEDELVTQKEDYANLANDVKELSYITQKYTIDSWQKVQELVRAGLADKAFRIGDQLIANYNGTPYTWDVIGINHDIPTDTNHVHSLTIQAHDCIMNCQFDAPEALYYAEVELPAGDYYFINSYEASKAYQLSLANAVPAGGIIFISGWATNSPTQIKTFADNITTTEIETVAIAEGSAGTQLSTINDIKRCQFGSNNYIESNIRQWLNSQDSSFTWEETTIYGKPSTGAPYTGGGFLNLLDPELAAVIGVVDKQAARNTVTDGGGQDIFNDKVFLLSRREVYGGDEGAVTGEKAYPWYTELAESSTVGELVGRIKYLNGTARHWWLRSPSTGNSYPPRSVRTTGYVSHYYAYIAFGLAPACCIV